MKISKKLLIGSITTLGAIGVGAAVTAPLVDSFANRNSSGVEVPNQDNNNNSGDNDNNSNPNGDGNQNQGGDENTDGNDNQNQGQDGNNGDGNQNQGGDGDTNTDPTPPVQLQKDATRPNDGTEIESSVTTIPVADVTELNNFLSENFEKSVKPTFNGYFKNVDVSLVKDSANFANKNFKISVTPTSGHAWEDGTTDAKEYTVLLPKMLLLARTSGALSYNDIIIATNSATLDSHLKSNFTAKKFSGATITNYTAEYVAGSANLENSSFKVKLTPVVGAAWYNGVNYGTTPVTVNVSFLAAIPVVSLSSADTFLQTFSASEVWNTETFNTKLTDLFKNSDSLKSSLSNDYSGTNISYVSGSADYDKGEFKITATPKGRFSWLDTRTKEARTITVKANIQKISYNTPLSVQNGGSRTDLIYGRPTVVLTSKTTNTTTYKANYKLHESSAQYGWTTLWSYSQDGGKTWTSEPKSALNPTVTVNNSMVKGSLKLKFEILFYIDGGENAPTVGWSMTFDAI
ncbi:hypothetical protein D8X55_00810 [Malacoplasma penetrans]|nr:hypothetical protein [Malacoplasma penetrans]RXY97226.1 hypothetical protein D8X55_00810 [Malacoplasma penetrans]